VENVDSINSLSELLSEQKSGSFIEIPGKLARTFGQATLSTTLPVSKLLSVYEVDLEVQRSIIPANLSKLIDYIQLFLDHNQTVYFPGIILSARGAGEYDTEAGVYRLKAIEKLYVVDGQHRLAAFQRLTESFQSLMARAKDRREYEKMDEITEKLNRLYQFPMSVMIYLDIDARQERQLFSDINKLPRKIGGNLAVLRDQRRFYHVVGTRLVMSDSNLKDIGIDVFTERGKGPEFMWSYHLLVEVLCALFEGRMRSAARNNGYQFTEQDEHQTMELASFYFDRLLAYLPKPGKGSIAWSENVQLALALFAHEEAVKTGSFNKYALDHTLKILPHIQWDSIYVGEEKDRLPRRSRIMKAYQFIKDFYNENQLLLIGDKEDAG
jgi:DNA sulfur modification protein DndB